MMFSFVYAVETSVLPGQTDASHDRPLGAVDRTGADLSSASLLPTSEFWLCVTSLSVKLPEHWFTLRSVAHIFLERILRSVIKIHGGIQVLDKI